MDAIDEFIFNKPKYKNLLDYLHKNDYYKNYDKFTNENKEEILSNFRFVNRVEGEKNTKNYKCFCSRRLKNVNYYYCILTKKLLECGDDCSKKLFGEEKEREFRIKQFNKKFIKRFSSGLYCFDPILNWEDYVEEVLEDFIQDLYNNFNHSEIARLLQLYRDEENVKNLIEGVIAENERRERERIEREERRARLEEQEREERRQDSVRREAYEKREKERLSRIEKEEEERRQEYLRREKQEKEEEEERERIEREKYLSSERKRRVAERKKRPYSQSFIFEYFN